MGLFFSRPPRPPVNQRVVVITGCDTGFGNGLALELDKLGYLVVATCLTSSGAENLKSRVSSHVSVVLMDVTKSADIERVKNDIVEQYPKGIYALVNNAGIGHGAPLEWTSMEAFRLVMEVNFFGYVAMTKALLPLLRKGYGRVINISSVAGLRGAPSLSAYCASKYAVEGMSDALRVEVEPFGIAVSLIEPFFMKTPIIADITTRTQALYNSLSDDLKATWGEEYLNHTLEESSRVNEIAGDPQQVVNVLVDALQASWPNSRYFVGPFWYWLLLRLPTWLVDAAISLTLFKPSHAYAWRKGIQ